MGDKTYICGVMERKSYSILALSPKSDKDKKKKFWSVKHYCDQECGFCHELSG